MHIHASVVNVCAGAERERVSERERERAVCTICARGEVTERNEGSSVEMETAIERARFLQAAADSQTETTRGKTPLRH